MGPALMMNKLAAFTLIEILVAVMLTGLLTTLALAPVVVTVNRVVDTQTEYSDFAALARTMNFIARDLNTAMRLAPNVITIVDHETISGLDDDALLIMCTAPAAQNLPSGTVVYKIADTGLLHNNSIQGLYRWLFPGKVPNVINTETLNIDDGQLVLPDVREFCAQIPRGQHDDNSLKNYSGQLPAAIYIKLVRGLTDDFSTTTYDNQQLNSHELENIIVFP